MNGRGFGSLDGMRQAAQQSLPDGARAHLSFLSLGTHDGRFHLLGQLVGITAELPDFVHSCEIPMITITARALRVRVSFASSGGLMRTLNEVYSPLSARRRYEVWFVRFGLADSTGAWWFRYLLTNPGRDGCAGDSRGMPVQVWATWFPRNEKPQTFIQGFPLQGLELSERGSADFCFRMQKNEIKQNSCRGLLKVDGHEIAWDLEFRSTFRVTISNKGWIGFSRTPHSNARFSGEVLLDGQRASGDPLGFGLQGHNCGYRHRGFWKWAHAYFSRPNGPASTFEALTYDMPFGLVFRKAVLWHESNRYVFGKFRETTNPQEFGWNLSCEANSGLAIDASFDGSGTNRHCLPYMKTDCSGTFEVTNNSLARALIRLKLPDGTLEELETQTGAVLEMAGNCAGG